MELNGRKVLCCLGAVLLFASVVMAADVSVQAKTDRADVKATANLTATTGKAALSKSYAVTQDKIQGITDVPPPNDDCVNAFPIASGECADGDNTEATIDCPGLLDWNASWWAIALPYAYNDLFIDYCGTQQNIQTVGIVVYYECDNCPAYIIAGSSAFVACGDGFTNPQMSWSSLNGPGVAYFPAYVVGDANLLFHFCVTVTEFVPVENPCVDNPDVIYYNGDPDGVNGLAAQRVIGGVDAWAVDPVILPDVTITDYHWWGISQDAFIWNETDDFIILDGSGGVPGVVFYEEWDIPNTRVATGEMLFGVPVYIYTIVWATPIPVPGGTYFLGARPVASAGGQNFNATSASGPDICPIQMWFQSNYFGFPDFVPGDTVFGVCHRTAFCITGVVEGTGACCYDETGECFDDVTFEECPVGTWVRFVPNTLCDNLQPPCGSPEGACCYDDGTCEITTEAACAGLCPGDSDCDGDIDYDDIDYFVVALGGEANWAAYYAAQHGGNPPPCDYLNNDCDDDGDVDYDDIDPFVLLIGTQCNGGGGGGLWLGPGTTCDMCPCIVPCPPGGVDESEPCGDDTNGGCNMATPAFEPITCGVPVCGWGWCDGSTRDTDWYEVTTAGNMIFTLTGMAEFPMVLGLIEPTIPGVCDCDYITGYIAPYAVAPACVEAVIVTDCMPEGCYWFFVGPSNWDTIIECGTEDGYVVTLTCEPCEIPTGACCVGQTCVETTTQQVCEVELGGNWYEGETCPEFQCPAGLEGDTCEDPFIIPDSLPYEDTTHNSCDFGHDYDEVCPYSGSTAPDVVYLYTPSQDVTVHVDLCDSLYDTKVYVYESYCGGTVVACNDDACGSTGFMSEVIVDMLANTPYYIVVDGYGTSCGVYDLLVEAGEPCIVECPPDGIPEGEPDCYDEYVDTYNGGCNYTPSVFLNFTCNTTICGTSGTYLFGGSQYREMDWFQMLPDPYTGGMVSMDIAAEFAPVNGWILDGTAGCAGIVQLYFGTSATGCLVVEGNVNAGVKVWLIVAPGVFAGIPCGLDSEYVVTLTCD